MMDRTLYNNRKGYIHTRHQAFLVAMVFAGTLLQVPDHAQLNMVLQHDSDDRTGSYQQPDHGLPAYPEQALPQQALLMIQPRLGRPTHSFH